jgi:hypothetical protein
MLRKTRSAGRPGRELLERAVVVDVEVREAERGRRRQLGVTLLPRLGPREDENEAALQLVDRRPAGTANDIDQSRQPRARPQVGGLVDQRPVEPFAEVAVDLGGERGRRPRAALDVERDEDRVVIGPVRVVRQQLAEMIRERHVAGARMRDREVAQARALRGVAVAPDVELEAAAAALPGLARAPAQLLVQVLVALVRVVRRLEAAAVIAKAAVRHRARVT